MECNVIKDLLPLYIDDCCSEESAKLVKEHIQMCSDCCEIYESMRASSHENVTVSAPKKLSRLNDWRASVMQSVLLFVSFAAIALGVALEAATPAGQGNGYWALSVIIPATGFMLSLANWYFIRLYRSRKSFSNCSMLATLGITACAYIWAGIHYQLGFLEVLSFGAVGLVLTAVLCILSKLSASKYAAMLGKE